MTDRQSAILFLGLTISNYILSQNKTYVNCVMDVDCIWRSDRTILDGVSTFEEWCTKVVSTIDRNFERHVDNSRTESTMDHVSLQTQSTFRQSPVWQVTMLISQIPAHQVQCTPHHVPAILKQLFGLNDLGAD